MNYAVGPHYDNPYFDFQLYETEGLDVVALFKSEQLAQALASALNYDGFKPRWVSPLT